MQQANKKSFNERRENSIFSSVKICSQAYHTDPGDYRGKKNRLKLTTTTKYRTNKAKLLDVSDWYQYKREAEK